MCLTGRLFFGGHMCESQTLIQQVINEKQHKTADIVTQVVLQGMLHILVLKVTKPSVIPENIHILAMEVFLV